VLPLIEQQPTERSGERSCTTKRAGHSPRERPEFLASILDDAGQQDAAAALTETPPTGSLIYRKVLRPRSDRHRLDPIPWPRGLEVTFCD
jgi:hypothetical protein